MNNTKRLVLILLFCLAGNVINNCSDSTKPEPRNIVRGIVTDSISGQPIDSAEIIISDTLVSTKNFISNSNGYYQAYPDTFNVAQIFCRKEGYLTKMTAIDLNRNEDIYDNVNFELAPE